MAWEIRNKRRVYYRSRRVGHQVQRDYFSGIAAELAASLDDKYRRDRQAERDQVRTLQLAWADRCQPLDDLSDGVSLLARAVLLTTGCLPRNKGRMNAASKEISAELFRLMERAERGEEAVLPELRRHLDAQPAIAAAFGDLSKHSEEVWINHIAGTNLFLAEATRRQLREWRAELAGPNPTPIEKIMVEQTSACWLQVQYADMIFAQQISAGVSTPVRRELERQRDNSRKRLLASLRQLAQTQKLLTPGKKTRTSVASAMGTVPEFPRLSQA